MLSFQLCNNLNVVDRHVMNKPMFIHIPLPDISLSLKIKGEQKHTHCSPPNIYYVPTICLSSPAFQVPIFREVIKKHNPKAFI
jgi:hypothetical protein